MTIILIILIKIAKIIKNLELYHYHWH